MTIVRFKAKNNFHEQFTKDKVEKKTTKIVAITIQLISFFTFGLLHDYTCSLDYMILDRQRDMNKHPDTWVLPIYKQ